MACFAVSKFAIWRANIAPSLDTLEAISGNDVVALLTRAVAVSLLLAKLAPEARPICHCLPLSSLVSCCVFFSAKTWSCDVYRAHRNNYHMYRPFCALSIALFCHEVFTSKVKPMQYMFSKLTVFPGQDLFIYGVCCEMP